MDASLNAMVIYNAATRELTAKIVYYGPGLGGKTTNLQVLHDRLEPSTVGKLLNLSTQTDRTIYFDLLPVELGDIKGYKIRFQLATVPGQTAFNETRRVVLKGTDGIVFVADSQWTMLPKNLESWQNLKENLKANGVSFEGIPVVVQYNKRDLTDILSVDAMQEALGLSSYPFVEAVASAGRGVTETFKLISKLTFVDLLRRLQGRRPEEAAPPPPRKEKDDLLSWKESLLTRSPAPPSARPSLSVVPSLPEESPFETEEPALSEAERNELADEPFAGLPPDGPSPTSPAPEEIARAGGERVESGPREFEFDPEADEEAPEPLSELEPVEPLADALDAESSRDEGWPVSAEVPPAAAPEPELGSVGEAFEARFRESQLPPEPATPAASVPAGPTPTAPGRTAFTSADPEFPSRIESLESRLDRREESDAGVASRVRALEELLEALRPRVDAHEERSAGFERRFESQEQRLGSIAERAGSVGERADLLEERLQTLERRVESVEPRLEGYAARFGAQDERSDSQEDRLRS